MRYVILLVAPLACACAGGFALPPVEPVASVVVLAADTSRAPRQLSDVDGQWLGFVVAGCPRWRKPWITPPTPEYTFQIRSVSGESQTVHFASGSFWLGAEQGNRQCSLGSTRAYRVRELGRG